MLQCLTSEMHEHPKIQRTLHAHPAGIDDHATTGNTQGKSGNVTTLTTHRSYLGVLLARTEKNDGQKVTLTNRMNASGQMPNTESMPNDNKSMKFLNQLMPNLLQEHLLIEMDANWVKPMKKQLLEPIRLSEVYISLLPLHRLVPVKAFLLKLDSHPPQEMEPVEAFPLKLVPTLLQIDEHEDQINSHENAEHGKKQVTTRPVLPTGLTLTSDGLSDFSG